MKTKLNGSICHGPFEVRYTDKDSNKDVSRFFSTKRESIDFIRSIIDKKIASSSDLIIFLHHVSLIEEYFPDEIDFSELGKEFYKLCLK